MTVRFIVSVLCALTSLTAALLLLRGFARSRARLLLWSGLCFLGFAVNNAVLVLDQRITQDLSELRTLPAILGVALLLYGLVWDSER